MKLVSEPSIPQKIQKMKERVRWEHPAFAERGIDRTGLVLDDGGQDDPVFSFLVFGDSGTGRHRGDSPQRRVAEAALAIGEGCRFTLHTGDVVYLVGSSEQYPDNFIQPYREYLVGGEKPEEIAYDRMVFQHPMLPVLGNHDYYDLPLIWGLISQAALPLRRVLRSQFNLDVDVGWHGSFGGDAYARAFLDYRRTLDSDRLAAHLDRHYTAKNSIGRCLHYQPGEFTRLPNRYYSFRYGGIDFFALDSNTFNEPQTSSSREQRQQLMARRSQLEQVRAQRMEKAAALASDAAEHNERIGDLFGEVEQLAEQIRDIDKQLKPVIAQDLPDVDQLDWLRDRLIASWRDPACRGRVLYFHHPPYVTEASKWPQAQTLAVRQNLRRVLTEVKAVVDDWSDGRPMVDLILNGHAHCLEYLRTADSGLADANIPCIVCGGSGYSLRRQREEGPDLYETIHGESRQVATSHLFMGRQGRGSKKRRPYSSIRIDVKPGTPPRFVMQPIVVERSHQGWSQPKIDPIEL